MNKRIWIYLLVLMILLAACSSSAAPDFRSFTRQNNLGPRRRLRRLNFPNSQLPPMRTPPARAPAGRLPRSSAW